VKSVALLTHDPIAATPDAVALGYEGEFKSLADAAAKEDESRLCGPSRHLLQIFDGRTLRAREEIEAALDLRAFAPASRWGNAGLEMGAKA